MREWSSKKQIMVLMLHWGLYLTGRHTCYILWTLNVWLFIDQHTTTKFPYKPRCWCIYPFQWFVYSVGALLCWRIAPPYLLLHTVGHGQRFLWSSKALPFSTPDLVLYLLSWQSRVVLETVCEWAWTEIRSHLVRGEFLGWVVSCQHAFQ